MLAYGKEQEHNRIYHLILQLFFNFQHSLLLPFQYGFIAVVDCFPEVYVFVSFRLVRAHTQGRSNTRPVLSLWMERQAQGHIQARVLYCVRGSASCQLDVLLFSSISEHVTQTLLFNSSIQVFKYTEQNYTRYMQQFQFI